MKIGSSEVRSRLESIDSQTALDSLLSALWPQRSKWRKPLVLFYLREEWHAAAEQYFQGDILRSYDRLERAWSDVRQVPLNEAIDAIKRNVSSVSTELGFVDAQRSRKNERRGNEDAVDENDIIASVVAALRDEIATVRRSKVARFRVQALTLLGTYEWGVAYGCKFTKSREPELYDVGWLVADDGRRVDAKVVEVGQRHHVMVADAAAPAVAERLHFVVDPSALLQAEIERLMMLRDTVASESFRHGIVPLNVTADDSIADISLALGVSPRQLDAINTVRRFPTSFVWGPPGTGKTTTLAALLEVLALERRRVMLLSNNNVAVDQAVIAAARRGKWATGAIVRVGRHSDDIRRAERSGGIDLHMNSHLERYAAESGVLSAALELALAAAREAGMTPTAPATVSGALAVLQKATAKLAESGSVYAERSLLTQAMKSLRSRFRAPEPDVLSSATIVGGTLTMEMLSPALASLVFDQVVVDEASVMRTSEVVRLLLRRGDRIAFFGDPKQLPPVVTSRTRRAAKWLQRNAFDIAGIARPGHVRPGCVFLNEQHRMAPEISDVVSRWFYDRGLLVGASAPGKGSIVVVDTSRTNASCHREYLTNGYSRFNRTHASLGATVADTVQRSQKDWQVRVMSPFRLQRKQYEQDPLFDRTSAARARVGTIHASQGAEAELVVVDLTVAPGGSRSKFLDESTNKALPNLLNVALSRTKRILVIIAHRAYLREEYKDCLVTKIVEELSANFVLVDAADGHLAADVRRVLRGIAEPN